MDQFDATQLPSGLTAGRLKAVALRQWWVVAVCGVVAALGTAGYAEKRPVRYTGDIVVSTGAQPTSLPSQSTPSLSMPDPVAEAESYQVAAAASAAASSGVKVSGAVSPDGTQVELAVQASSLSGATRAAMAAAKAFVKLRVHDINTEAAALSPQLHALSAKIAPLEHQVTSVQRGAGSAGSSNASLPTRSSTELAVLTNDYTALYTQQVELQLAAQSVQVDQTGPPTVSSSGGGKKRLVAIGLGVGLLAGCGLGLLRDLSRDRLTHASELSELGRLPLLAEVPDSPLRRRVNVIRSFGGSLGEAARELRTSLSLAPGGRPAKVILVTSAASGEGKSFLAANLAVAYALGGARTVLVSSDLRHPAAEKLFGVRTDQSSGLAAFLRDWPASSLPNDAETEHNGQAPNATSPDHNPDMHLVGTQFEGLALVPAGPLPPNPADLIASRAMMEFIGWLRANSDVVILDSPPLLAVTDAAVLSKYADATVLVVASGRSSKSNVRHAIATLELVGAPVAGYVLNRTTRSSHIRYRYVNTHVELNGSTARSPASTRAT
ncbi:MAG: CpsD/CapB family tyrosine-protein kinase [Actinobacteria bacterium]|nr:CpsD/CapB family tyrosine-protein kinase [Actinomycetota bacterium]